MVISSATAWTNWIPALLQSMKKETVLSSCSTVARRPARGLKKASVRESEFFKWWTKLSSDRLTSDHRSGLDLVKRSPFWMYWTKMNLRWLEVNSILCIDDSGLLAAWTMLVEINRIFAISFGVSKLNAWASKVLYIRKFEWITYFCVYFSKSLD